MCIRDRTSDDVTVVDASQGIQLDASHEEDEDGDGHDHAYDPHIWTSPVLAQQMVANIADALCEEDPEGEEIYRQREETYQKQLQELDEKFSTIISEASRKEIVFAGRFADVYKRQLRWTAYPGAGQPGPAGNYPGVLPRCCVHPRPYLDPSFLPVWRIFWI